MTLLYAGPSIWSEQRVTDNGRAEGQQNYPMKWHSKYCFAFLKTKSQCCLSYISFDHHIISCTVSEVWNNHHHIINFKISHSFTQFYQLRTTSHTQQQQQTRWQNFTQTTLTYTSSSWLHYKSDCPVNTVQIQLLDWPECERHQYLVNFSLQEDAPLLLKWSITGIVWWCLKEGGPSILASRPSPQWIPNCFTNKWMTRVSSLLSSFPEQEMVRVQKRF